MSFRVITSFGFRILPIAAFFCSLSIGLIGTRYAKGFSVFFILLLFFVPEIIHYLKWKRLKSSDYNYLMFKTEWFPSLLKRMALLGIVSGIASNYYYQTSAFNAAENVIYVAIFAALLILLIQIAKQS